MSYQYPLDPQSIFGEQQLEANPDFSPELLDLSEIHQSEELPDGSAVFTIGKPEKQEKKHKPHDFHENLAENMEDGILRGLSARLLEEIRDDRESRREWENTVNTAFKYLGLKVEEFRPEPFAWACGAFDTTLSTTLMNFFALARASLFPPGGPAKVELEGVPTDEIYDRGERVRMFMNYFLTVVDRPYYSDSDKLILFVGLYGCAFRKIIMDPVLEHPTARLVMPQDLIVNNNCTSLLESTRITQEIILTRREILIRQRNKIYLKDTLPSLSDDMDDDQGSAINKTIKQTEGIKTNNQENKSTFKFYECHVELVSDDVNDEFVKKDRDIPRPYIVEINQTTKKICSIRRNWKESDLNYKRIECFVHYYYLPGFGLYGIGLAQLLGSNAIVLSTITRQQLDAGTLKNFPGGLRQRGMRLESNDKAVGPAEFVEIETGGAPIQDSVMLMPYGEPSSVLAQLRTELKQETEKLGGASQQGIQDVGGNTPVGTILAQLEVQNRVPSTILKSMYVSLSEELCILKELFAEYFGDEPYPFNVPGNQSYVMKADFSDNVSIIPVADPNVMTTTQRIIVNEMLLKFAQSAPEIHNVREAFHRMYSSMNVQNIDAILPPQPQPEQTIPLDPITENANAMQGKPVKAGMDQEHDAHIMVHGDFAGKIAQQNPQAAAALQAHINEHTTMKYVAMLYASMGIPIPDPQTLQDPQVQNTIAVHAAQVLQQQQQAQSAVNPPPLDPVRAELELGRMEVEQRSEASHLKHEEAQLRAETEAFKAQSKFESEKAKLEAQQTMAEEKNQLTLAVEQMKQHESSENML